MHCSSFGIAVLEIGLSGRSGVWMIWNEDSSMLSCLLGERGDVELSGDFGDFGDFGDCMKLLILRFFRYGDSCAVQFDFLPCLAWSFMLTVCGIVQDVEGSADGGAACLKSMASKAFSQGCREREDQESESSAAYAPSRATSL